MQRLTVRAALLAAVLFPCAFAAPAQAETCGAGGEWLCHKTADGQHPDGVEQAFVC